MLIMKKSKDACVVKDCFLCRGCMPEWLPLIELNRKNLYFKKGEEIFCERTPVNGIYFLNKGKVKVHKQWGKEKELILRFSKAGDIIGHRGVGAENIYPVSATALEPVTICFIEMDFFKKTLLTNPKLCYELMLLYAAELHAAEQRMHHLVHMDMKGRISDCLLAMQNQFGQDNEGNINFIISRQDLASFAGTSYETVFRIMNELTQYKVLKLKNKNIRILNESLLTAYTKAL